MITRNVTLWFGSAPRVTIPVSQYDDMWQFVFSIVNDSVPWSIPDSAQVTLNGLKPDGNVFAYYGMVSGGKATVDCDIQMTAVAGLVECELSILDSSKVVGTANFFLAVEQAPKADDAVVSESTLAAYGEVLDQISQYAAGFIPEAVKTTLLNCFAHVAWVDEHGQDYYDALADALAQKTLVSISAVFTQGSAAIYTSDTLDALTQYLVVTATYDDTSTETVASTDYTLSGTLTTGTSTITVTFEGKTDTFTVTVTQDEDVAPSLSTFVPGNATYAAVVYNSTANTLRIYSKSNWSYISAKTPFTMSSGYEYFVTYDLEYTSGSHCCGFAKSNGSVLDPMPAYKVTESTHISRTIPYNAEIAQLYFYVTWSTSMAGDCTISNFHIYKRPASGV